MSVIFITVGMLKIGISPRTRKPQYLKLVFKEYIKTLTQAQRDLMAQVVTLLKLILMPATNATLERSFSTLW